MEVAPGMLKDTTDLAKTSNYVFRGRVIALTPDRTVSMCFDTEHLRVAGVWVGKPVTYASGKNMGPSVEGRMVFGTRPGPGWAKDGQWDDPRPGKEGPLPRERGHYQGFYRHGDKVILKYTVGGVPVLEHPTARIVKETAVVTRHFQFGPTTKPLQLLLAEEPKASSSVDGSWAEMTSGGSRLVALHHGAPANSSWEISGGRLTLTLPPLPRGGQVRIDLARLPVKADRGILAPLQKDKMLDLTAWTKGGPARWPEIQETKGTLNSSGAAGAAYVVDDITPPVKNPWNASIRYGGLDFFPDGRAALCTWDGDVWIVSGLDDKLEKVRWRRFAAGLHQPLGLKIIDGVIYTAGRDQITRLHDLNGDGEADYYENFNNAAGLTLQRHEFVMDLHTDQEGNLYYCRSGHYLASPGGFNCSVHKVSSDGSKLEILAKGFREPNGMSVGPGGVMTVSDNEGNGIPQSPVYLLRPGKDYGYFPSKVVDDGGKGTGWKYKEPPIVWLPKHVDRSSGGQIWATSDRWGPFKDHLLHTSYGNSSLFALLIDKQAEPWQGAVWKFPLAFDSGIMRGRFNPKDGQLYLCGLRGWETNGVKDGQFCRVRYTGAKTPLPVGYRTTKAGIELTFSEALDRKSATDDQNWAGDWSNPVPLPGTKGSKDKVEMPIGEITLSADGKTVVITLDERRPMANFALQYRLRSAGREPVMGVVQGTIHRFQ